MRGSAVLSVNGYVRWLAAGLIVLLGTGPVLAQATRTWVSGVGDDANPCSRTAPCKTFAGAISKTAAGGEINVLDPGGFGAVTITKAISIEGDNALSGVLVSGTNGIVVSAGPTDTVRLRGLAINGLNTGLSGIRFNSGKLLSVEKCTIERFVTAGINHLSPGSALVVKDCEIRDCPSVAGILVAPGGTSKSTASIDGTSSHGNGYGIRSETSTNVVVRNCDASNNSAHGFVVVGGTMSIENSLAGHNGAAGVYSGGSGGLVRMSNVTVVDNVTGITGVIQSFGNNRIAGNTTDGTPTNMAVQQ